MSDNKWSQPDAPPPPLFTGKKERDLVKQVNDELIERVIGQQVLYYPISLEHTDFHSLYGEAIKKSFENRVQKLIIVTGKGLHSKNDKDPYVSKDLGILKYSIPDYLSKNSELMKMISQIELVKIKLKK